MNRDDVIARAQRMEHLERFRLATVLGRTPTPQEVHDSVREACVAWCESWFSDAEKALPQEAKRALALQWLDETGVLAVISQAEAEDDLLLPEDEDAPLSR